MTSPTALSPAASSPAALSLGVPPGAQTGAQKNVTAAQEAEARKAAQSFESFLLFQLLEHMSAGLETDGPFGGGFAESTWRSQLNEQYADILAKRGGIGLTENLYREILRLQEARQ